MLKQICKPIKFGRKGMKMFFKKKKTKDEIVMTIANNAFCAVKEIKVSDVTHKCCVQSDEKQYTLLYRNGKYLGMPCPFGGEIYPFSLDPRNPGKKKELKNYRSAKVVAILKEFELKVPWGSDPAYTMEDPITKKPFEVGAFGEFYVTIDHTDAARNADKFYKTCLAQTDANNYDIFKLREFLLQTFNMRIGAEIQNFINEEQRSLENYVGLTPIQILKISEKLTPRIKDIFASYGLTVNVLSTSGSLLQALNVSPKVI